MKDVREVAERARARLGERGQGTILFLDEVHRFSRAQQDVLLPVRRGRAARARRRDHGEPVLLAHRPAALAQHAVPSRTARRRRPARARASARSTDIERGLGDEPTGIDADALEHLVDKSEGDARHLLTVLEVAHALAVERSTPKIELKDAEAALALRSVHYGDDEHYDIVSAFIKSIRGSDPDAGLYWLARMLEAGEDARFVARRLVILASEDVGLAEPNAILVAEAAARAVEYVGLPEAALNLAHAVVHLALAPKSNSVTAALGAATAAVRDRRAGPVPMHLRDSHYRGAQSLGHGEGYVYPHDVPQGWVPQDRTCLPKLRASSSTGRARTAPSRRSTRRSRPGGVDGPVERNRTEWNQATMTAVGMPGAERVGG